MPNAVLKLALNHILPGALKRVLLEVLPDELGEMLHRPAFALYVPLNCHGVVQFAAVHTIAEFEADFRKKDNPVNPPTMIVEGACNRSSWSSSSSQHVLWRTAYVCVCVRMIMRVYVCVVCWRMCL